jgi:hypothetical protein
MAIKIKGTPIIDDGRSIINAGISTISGVTINTGIITSSDQAGIVTYYGDASNLSKNFPLVTNILYVSKNGNDGNPGTRLSEPKATVGAALTGATAGTVIKVSAGTYIENNPLNITDQVSIIGDSLREVSIQPLHADKDLFYVSNGNYIAEMSFTGSMNSGNAIFSFNPNIPVYNNQSPYIQNCTNFIPNSIGMRIDGRHSIGPTKSMVLDSYTQYNQGGIGVSITNEGYAQLVSLFTICDDVAVYCGSGGACDLTNSNSSFGNYGLVADGVSSRKYTGIITQAAPENSDTFVLDLSTPTLGITTASYDNATGILTAFTSTPHNFSVGMGVSIANLQFSCPYEPGTRLYPSGQKGYIFETKTVAAGRFVDSYNLIQANRQEIIDTSFAEIAIVYPTFTNPNPDKCKRDLGYIVDAVSTDVRDFTSQNIISATKSYFDPTTKLLLINGLQDEVPQTITAFHKARDTMKLAITNNLTVKDLTVVADPNTGFNTDPASCANVQSFIDNLVGIITTRINTGNLNTLPLPSVSMASTVFTMNVGVATQPHTYVPNTGTAKINVSRPFDGQVVYFSDLYYTANKIRVSVGGTGYTSTPTVTISSPPTSWGVPATAVAEISNGSVSAINIISNGRGYATAPAITISSPNVGINTAKATIELVPTYYSILSSTPVSSGICTIKIGENIPYAIGVGTAVPFFKQSRVLASGHSLEYIGSGTEIAKALPAQGGVTIQDNEIDARNGGLVVFTSTDQSGNFRIGDGVVINQQTGTISGTFYSKSLFSAMTPYILALGGE